MPALYKQLNITKKQMPIKMITRLFNESRRELNEAKYPDDIVSFLISDSHVLAIYSHYMGQKEETKNYAAFTIDYTLEYFFGKWREEKPIDNKPPDPHIRKKFEPWSDDFRESIFWASCLGDWDAVEKLASYPTDECPVGRYEPKLFCVWLLLLTAVLRGEALDKLAKYTSKIDKSRRKYYILLLNMLRAVLSSDADKFDGLLKNYLDYCNEHTFTRPEIDEKISMDGTFLINFARHRGLKVTIPPEYINRIVVLEDCGSHAQQNA